MVEFLSEKQLVETGGTLQIDEKWKNCDFYLIFMNTNNTYLFLTVSYNFFNYYFSLLTYDYFQHYIS